MRQIILLTVTSACALSACVYPVYKTLQPGLSIMVRDESGTPVGNAKVVLSTRIHASGGQPQSNSVMTDINGAATFASRQEWQTETTMIHGSLNYSWTLCVEKPGYTTFFSRDLHSADQEKTIRLSRGAATLCRDNF